MKKMNCIVLAVGLIAATSTFAFAKKIGSGISIYSVGKPYVVGGITYRPHEDPSYRVEGNASWYGADFHGRRTANGEVYNMNAISAAHPTLPLPSYVRVTNLANHRSIVVRVNDRGPFRNDRVIDVSVRVAKLIGIYERGVAQVRVEYVGRAPLNASDQTKLAQTLRYELLPPFVPPAQILSLAATEPIL